MNKMASSAAALVKKLNKTAFCDGSELAKALGDYFLETTDSEEEDDSTKDKENRPPDTTKVKDGAFHLNCFALSFRSFVFIVYTSELGQL